jgi:hypothetical protein
MSTSLAQAVDLAEFAPLLYRVRDELLSQTDRGQHYISLFEEHTTEVAYILFENPDLYQQGYEVIKSFEDHLQALVDGEADTAIISSEQVSGLQTILDAVAAKASPDLLSAIQTESKTRPLEELIGLSMDEAWNHLNGYNLTWLPPIITADPYEGKQGSTIPIQFAIETLTGEFVEDDTVFLQVVNQEGEVVAGPFSLDKYPAQGISIQGKKYHLNLKTKDLAPGEYTVEVYYNSVLPDVPATWDLLLLEK